MNIFEQLNTLITIVDQGNFSKAATKLKISPMAVSKQMKTLESSLGVTIFDRSTRHMKLTSIGLAIYDRCQAALDTVTDIKAIVATEKTDPEGLLSISCSSGFAQQLVDYLGEFCSIYNKIDIDVVIYDGYPVPTPDKYDILYGRSYSAFKEAPTNLIANQLVDTNLGLYAHKDYLQLNGTPECIEDLVDHVYINHSQRFKTPILDYLRERDLAIKKIVNINHTLSHYKSIISGMGVGLVLEYIAEPDLEKNNLVRLLPDEKFTQVVFYYFYSALKYIEPKIKCFSDFVLEKLNQ